jgi:ABC-type glycerol-3-phosphate transport system permease component
MARPEATRRALRVHTRKALWTVATALVAFVFSYPFILTLFTSVKPEDEIIDNPFALPHSINLDAYRTAWDVLHFGTLLENSLLYAGVGALIATLVAIVPAYAFSRLHLLGRRTIFMLLLTTLMLPQQTVLVPLYGLLNDTGTLNTRAGLIAIHAAYGFPLQLLILAGFLSSMPRDIEDAAHIDGCGDISMLRHVVIPLSLPAMAVGFLLNFVGIWKEFIFALTFLSADKVLPITTGLLKFTNAQYFSSFALPAAAVVLAQIPMLIVFLAANRWMTQGIYAGSVKG